MIDPQPLAHQGFLLSGRHIGYDLSYTALTPPTGSAEAAAKAVSAVCSGYSASLLTHRKFAQPQNRPPGRFFQRRCRLVFLVAHRLVHAGRADVHQSAELGRNRLDIFMNIQRSLK